MRFNSQDGRIRVDVIELTSTKGDITRTRAVYRITKDGYFVADARDILELERFVDLRRLEEADDD